MHIVATQVTQKIQAVLILHFSMHCPYKLQPSESDSKASGGSLYDNSEPERLTCRFVVYLQVKR